MKRDLVQVCWNLYTFFFMCPRCCILSKCEFRQSQLTSYQQNVNFVSHSAHAINKMWISSDTVHTLSTKMTPQTASCFKTALGQFRRAKIAQWLEHQTRDRKVEGSSTGRSGGRISFSMINCLWWLLFRYPFHPRVIARKRSRSFWQKCRWQVSA